MVASWSHFGFDVRPGSFVLQPVLPAQTHTPTCVDRHDRNIPNLHNPGALDIRSALLSANHPLAPRCTLSIPAKWPGFYHRQGRMDNAPLAWVHRVMDIRSDERPRTRSHRGVHVGPFHLGECYKRVFNCEEALGGSGLPYVVPLCSHISERQLTDTRSLRSHPILRVPCIMDRHRTPLSV